MEDNKKLLMRVIIRIAFFPLFLGLAVLLPAGTFRFWQAYLYFGILLIPLCIAMVYFYRNDPDFLEKRMKTRETESTQKLFVALASVSIIGIFVITGLDRRFAWSHVPFPAVLIGDGLVLLSYLFVYLVFRTNSYASRVVEVSDEQKVITTGPYAVVRHPMYTGILVMYAASSVALGSWWGLVPSVLLIPVLILRIGNEEKVLREQLPGYKAYCSLVRKRLIPFIW